VGLLVSQGHQDVNGESAAVALRGLAELVYPQFCFFYVTNYNGPFQRYRWVIVCALSPGLQVKKLFAQSPDFGGKRPHPSGVVAARLKSSMLQCPVCL